MKRSLLAIAVIALVSAFAWTCDALFVVGAKVCSTARAIGYLAIDLLVLKPASAVKNDSVHCQPKKELSAARSFSAKLAQRKRPT